MQSSLEFFCEECGAANPDDAIYCVACKELLTRSPGSLASATQFTVTQFTVTPIKPVVVTPPVTLAVTAGATSIPAAPVPVSVPEAVVSDRLLPGTLLQNRYRIAREIGEGGYSIVYKATDRLRSGLTVTIKQIN